MTGGGNLSQRVNLTPTPPKTFEQSLEMPWMAGGGKPIPAGLPYPLPRLWISDCVQILKMTFKCYISENGENTRLFIHFLLVYNNQLLEMPWMAGGSILSQLVYLTPHP